VTGGAPPRTTLPLQHGAPWDWRPRHSRGWRRSALNSSKPWPCWSARSRPVKLHRGSISDPPEGPLVTQRRDLTATTRPSRFYFLRRRWGMPPPLTQVRIRTAKYGVHYLTCWKRPTTRTWLLGTKCWLSSVASRAVSFNMYNENGAPEVQVHKALSVPDQKRAERLCTLRMPCALRLRPWHRGWPTRASRRLGPNHIRSTGAGVCGSGVSALSTLRSALVVDKATRCTGLIFARSPSLARLKKGGATACSHRDPVAWRKSSHVQARVALSSDLRERV